MIFIVEGPDGAGKTTIAKYLCETLDAHYIHDRHVKDQWCLNTAQLRLAIKYYMSGQHVVLDRHWLGDNVYGSTFRGGGSLWVRRIDSVLQRFGAVYILCLPPIDQLEERFQELRQIRPEKFNTIREVACRYHDLYYGNVIRPFDGDYVEQQSCLYPWADSNRIIFVYDRFKYTVIGTHRWLKGTVIPAAKDLHDNIRNADPLARELDAWELSGTLRYCKALLVGERGKHPLAAVNWPFYANVHSPAYLTKALHKAKVCETHIALTNAKSIKGNNWGNFMKIFRWVKDNRPEVKVVAMGAAAEKAITYHGYRFDASIPHPQWACRFAHNGEWWKQLEAAIYGGVKW